MTQQRDLCPICGKPAIKNMHPFCSKGCKNLDLHRWLGGHYVIPGPAATEEDLAAHTHEQQKQAFSKDKSEDKKE